MVKVLGWLVVGLGFVVGGLEGPARAEDPSRVVYEGQLLDSAKRPLSGVFPMEFNLFRSEKSTRGAWSEQHFIAVEDGRYTIELGATKPIPSSLNLDRVYLGVTIGGQELVRELLRTAPVAKEPAGKRPSATAPSAEVTKDDVIVTAPRQRTAEESYAEIAGFAYEAERAKVADSIGGMTARELQALIKEARQPVSIGSRSRESGVAGGSGGQPYTLKCPKGHIMTGITGSAAALVDSVGIICSPLE